jgi:hypothetical protein
MEISPQKSERRSSRKRYHHLIVPAGLGLNEDDFRLLIDDWIVPRLVQTLVDLGVSQYSDKKLICSVSVISPSRIASNQGDNISRLA